MTKGCFLVLICLSAFTCAKAQQDSIPQTRKVPDIPSELSDTLRQKSRYGVDPLLYDYRRQVKENDGQHIITYSHTNTNKGFLHAPYTKFIIPTACVVYGLMAQSNKSLRSLDTSTHHEISEHYTGRFPIDDYMQFAPYAAYYALDLLGVKAKHNFRDRTIVLAASAAIMAGTVQVMKSSFGVERPDGSSRTSFPSGHTATAFLGAHLLFREYKEVSPWIGVAGYVSAATVGCLRVRNEKHWVSDVVAGAGVGILSAEAGYLLLPVFHKLLGVSKNNKTLVAVPEIGIRSYGLGLSYTF